MQAMKVLVTGCGRGGTNLGIELVRTFDHFDVTSEVEDRKFFKRADLPPLYATKLATENDGFNNGNIDRMMAKNMDLRVIFMVRHPVDICLSKILRGRPASQGGDSTVEQTAGDGTVIGAIEQIEKMYSLCCHMQENYSDRLMVVKMEDLISNTDSTIVKVADFLAVSPTESSKTFFANNRNRYQKRRYGNTLHKNIDLYKDLTNNFEGLFNGKESQVEKIEKLLNKISKGTGY